MNSAFLSINYDKHYESVRVNDVLFSSGDVVIDFYQAIKYIYSFDNVSFISDSSSVFSFICDFPEYEWKYIRIVGETLEFSAPSDDTIGVICKVNSFTDAEDYKRYCNGLDKETDEEIDDKIARLKKDKWQTFETVRDLSRSLPSKADAEIIIEKLQIYLQKDEEIEIHEKRMRGRL